MSKRIDPEIYAHSLERLRTLLIRHKGRIYCCVRKNDPSFERLSVHVVQHGRLLDITLDVAHVLGESTGPSRSSRRWHITPSIKQNIPSGPTTCGRNLLTERLCLVLFESRYGLTCEGL